MENSTPVTMPAVVKEKLSVSDCPASDADHATYDEFAQGFGYLECLSGILYTMHTRPDIQYAMNVCAQFRADPGKLHLIALKRVLCYLKGMAHHGLVLEKMKAST